MELNDIPLSRNADVRTSLRFYFTAIQTRYSELRLSVFYKAGDVFGLALRGLDGLRESGEARTWFAALDGSGAEHLANIDALQNHEWDPLDENRHLEHQPVC